MSYALNARWGMTAECDLTKSHLEYLGAKLFQSKSMVVYRARIFCTSSHFM